MFPETHGIYRIHCIPTDQSYVGLTRGVGGFYTRLRMHKWQLERGRHTNNKLQGAWNLHGAASFAFEILQEIDPSLSHEMFDRAEIEYIQRYRARESGFNKARGGAGKLNPRHNAKVPRTAEEKQMSPVEFLRHRRKLWQRSKRSTMDPEKSAAIRAQQREMVRTLSAEKLERRREANRKIDAKRKAARHARGLKGPASYYSREEKGLLRVVSA